MSGRCCRVCGRDERVVTIPPQRRICRLCLAAVEAERRAGSSLRERCAAKAAACLAEARRYADEPQVAARLREQAADWLLVGAVGIGD